MSFSNLICIVGTDTSIGKTIIGSSICSFIRSYGFSVGVFKPAETGCLSDKGILPQDGLLLKEAASSPDPIETIVPYRLCKPLSPAEASKIDGVTISKNSILEILPKMTASYDFVLMEGAGGLLVPFSSNLLFADILEAFFANVLVVGRSTLGTVNHTLLTLSELDRRKINTLGFILNRLTENFSLEEKSNPSSISQYTPHTFFGVFPFVPVSCRHDFDYLSSSLKKSADPLLLSILLKMAGSKN